MERARDCNALCGATRRGGCNADAGARACGVAERWLHTGGAEPGDRGLVVGRTEVKTDKVTHARAHANALLTDHEESRAACALRTGTRN
jgi:hypothetical protein